MGIHMTAVEFRILLGFVSMCHVLARTHVTEGALGRPVTCNGSLP